ncbi:MAG: SAM-dependent methyltransferase [Gammaproteobacteria bacterium]|nr:MAG: SAM-dependent methyltransferase [Gammaproteobacteria bacterium]
MEIDNPEAYQVATELEIIQRVLPLENARILELGCGKAAMTRRLSQRFHPSELIATEVDRIQHDINLKIDDLPNVSFVYGGVEDIALLDNSVDVVLMLKSLHHVPSELMAQGLKEVCRVLKPGGLAYISEPIYRGGFNDILKLFHDEQVVRQSAFDALQSCVSDGLFELVEQIFFNVTVDFADFAAFEDQVIKVTHTEHKIDDVLYEKIKAVFIQHMADGGAYFSSPSRVDLLKKPG